MSSGTNTPDRSSPFVAAFSAVGGVIANRSDAEEGAFDDAVGAFSRWHRGGLRLAVFSGDGSDAALLQRSGLTEHLDVIDDRSNDDEAFAAALSLFGVDAADTVALGADKTFVEQAREAGFGLVVGVDRDGTKASAKQLRRAGAHVVVRDLSGLRFARRLPHVMERRGELERRRAGRDIALFLDFDGTLAPIVDEPDAAGLSDEMRRVVKAAAERFTVAVVSGRDRPDVRARVGLYDLYYAGSHGFDIAGPRHAHTLPQAEAAIPQLEIAEARLRRAIGGGARGPAGSERTGIEGLVLERKRFSLAVHYRMVADSQVERVVDAVHDAVASRKRLRVHEGKKVLDLQPDVDWHKGRAVRWLMDALDIDPARHLVLYIGDDETDEDAFEALGGDGVGVRVGPEVSDSLGDYWLAHPGEVRAFLTSLVERVT